jgi:hypothetical protein
MPSFSRIMALARSTASGLPRMMKFFSCASGGAFLSTVQWAPVVWRTRRRFFRPS